MLDTDRPSHLLAERVILVTGASYGIGRAAAKHFASHGATVILLARTIQKLETLYDEIEGAGFPTPAIYPMNLAHASPQDYHELIKTIEIQFGRLDGVLANAAFLGSLTPIEYYPIDQWYQVLQVNLNSVFLLTQAAIPLLKCAPDASILLTSAPTELHCKAYWGAYGITKCAIQGFMQILADELEHHATLRVNSITPLKVRTALRQSGYPAENQAELPHPQDILSRYLYLIGPQSTGVNGKNFTIPAANEG